MDFIDTLNQRGLIQDASDIDGIRKLSGVSFYCGFDPTAPSLQIGNLVPILSMIHIAQGGLRPIALLGGATGCIGDPSGKSEERNLLTLEKVEQNVENQRKQFLKLFEKLGIEMLVTNNASWTSEKTFLDFLRDVGKYFTVNYMLQKDSVKSRLEGDGISYTEFSYMLIQANDFLHLYENENCSSLDCSRQR